MEQLETTEDAIRTPPPNPDDEGISRTECEIDDVSLKIGTMEAFPANIKKRSPTQRSKRSQGPTFRTVPVSTVYPGPW